MFVKDSQSWDKFVIKVDRKIKIQDFLREELGFSSRSISRIKSNKNIFVNGEYKKTTLDVYPDDIIEIYIDDGNTNFKPQNMGVEYIYEDFDVIVADKPSYMVVHPTKSHFENTLANDVTEYLRIKGENPRISFVNRLDMNTSGIVLIAKNGFAHHRLSEDMSDNIVTKQYIAVVHGVVEKDRGIIDLPIYRPTDDSIKRIVDDRGQKSLTEYEVVRRFSNATLLKLKLHTGRTHQIRVHLSSIGHPIYGDELYGVEDSMDRQALHAFRMVFRQPRFGEEIDIEAKIPDDIEKLIKSLE